MHIVYIFVKIFVGEELMEKIGIICEYNPFHNGHLYHIETIKKMYPDALIVLVLGSYFLERGDISLISKWNKTKIALDYGVDIVLELPTLYNTNSADIFASSSIKILHELKVDKLVFGSECDDIHALKKLAELQDDEDFQNTVKGYLRDGQNYPTSISKTLGTTLESNDILAVSYIKAINKIDASIEPVTIKRTNHFNDTTSSDTIISAQNIRMRLKQKEDINTFIPPYPKEMINEIDEELLFTLLKYKIMTDNNLSSYLGVEEGIENRITSCIEEVEKYDDLVVKLSTKRYTKSRIKRMLIHILLGITKEDITFDRTVHRILGFSALGKDYLHTLSSPNLTTKPLDRAALIENRAAKIYYMLTHDQSTNLEDQNRPIIK